MSYENTLTKDSNLSDFTGSTANWAKNNRTTFIAASLIGGVVSLSIHLFGPGYLPFKLYNWAVYITYLDFKSIGSGALFWFTSCLLVFAAIGYARASNLQTLGTNLLTSPGSLKTRCSTANGKQIRPLIMGLAAGFVYVAMSNAANSAIPSNSYGFYDSANTALIVKPPLQLALVFIILLFAFSQLSYFATNTLNNWRSQDKRPIAPEATSVFCLAAALPLLLTIPIGQILLTSKVALLLAALGFLIWSSNRGTAASLLLILGFAGLFPGELLAQNNYWDNYPPIFKDLVTKDQWLNAALAFFFAFLGSGVGLSIGGALASTHGKKSTQGSDTIEPELAPADNAP